MNKPIPLLFPYITATGQTMKEITPRRLKVKDLREIGEESGGSEIKMEILGVARVCQMIPEDLEEMDAVDYQQVKGRFLEYVGVKDPSSVGNGATSEVVSVSTE